MKCSRVEETAACTQPFLGGIREMAGNYFIFGKLGEGWASRVQACTARVLPAEGRWGRRRDAEGRGQWVNSN